MTLDPPQICDPTIDAKLQDGSRSDEEDSNNVEDRTVPSLDSARIVQTETDWCSYSYQPKDMYLTQSCTLDSGRT